MILNPVRYDTHDISFDKIVGNETEIEAAYDPHCVNDVSGGCEPVEVISAERLTELGKGPAEGRKIARALKDKEGVKDFLMSEDAWECVWTELIVNKKGVKTFLDREGLEERDYNFSEEMLDAMLVEVNRLITKYSGSEWTEKATAINLVELLIEHRTSIEDEVAEVRAGIRKLRKTDFLGSKTRMDLFPVSKDTEEQ